jgi:hypothetical protein
VSFLTELLLDCADAGPAPIKAIAATTTDNAQMRADIK